MPPTSPQNHKPHLLLFLKTNVDLNYFPLAKVVSSLVLKLNLKWSLLVLHEKLSKEFEATPQQPSKKKERMTK